MFDQIGISGHRLYHLSAAQTIDLTAIAFGGLAFRGRFVTRHGLALFRHFEARFAAGFRLAIERLRHRGGAAHFAQASTSI